MNSETLLTRTTIWIALAGYLAGVTALVCARTSGRGLPRWWRTIWTLAAFASVAHVVCAFHFHHGWSHASAYAGTARQTAERFGLNWGGGIYFNYALIALWIWDAACSWAAWEKYQRRPHWIGFAVQAFFAFMWLNAMVVFPTGAVRWIGVAAGWLIAWLWWARRRVDGSRY